MLKRAEREETMSFCLVKQERECQIQGCSQKGRGGRNGGGGEQQGIEGKKWKREDSARGVGPEEHREMVECCENCKIKLTRAERMLAGGTD